MDPKNGHSILIDAIDKLRALDVGKHVDIPQIIVCGDQSSGKSSILGGLSDFPFPVDETLCTRMATELILRRDPQEETIISITAGESASEDHKKRCEQFKMTYLKIENFKSVVDDAMRAVGIGTFEGKTFSDDTLRVEMRGPHQVNLTLVDLPGLFHGKGSEHKPKDRKLVKNLVRRYMEKERSIILAVVSAAHEALNQLVTRMAGKYDPHGKRTLGIITKPDLIPRNSRLEQAFMKLARNEDVPLRLKWHAVRNRDHSTMDATKEERDQTEADFFSSGPWASLSPSILGIESLKKRLSIVLRNQILNELPGLMKDIQRGLQECDSRKKALGIPRETLHDQRLFLVTMSQRFSDLVRDALDGSYHHEFFGKADSDSGYQKRLRAVTQNQILQFSKIMQKRGHSQEIIEEEMEISGEEVSGEESRPCIKRADYLEHVRKLMIRNRGLELPGTGNPLIVTELFIEQAQPWKELTEKCCEEVVASVKRTLATVVFYVSDRSSREGILKKVINPKVEKLVVKLNEEIEKILEAHGDGYHAITFNPSFIRRDKEMEAKREKKRLEEGIKALARLDSGKNGIFPLAESNVGELLDAMTPQPLTDMDLNACSKYTDTMEAYYTTALERFVDMTGIAIENCLLRPIKTIFTSEDAFKLDGSTVKAIAEESADSKRERDLCKAKEKSLKQGHDVLMGLYQEKQMEDFRLDDEYLSRDEFDDDSDFLSLSGSEAAEGDTDEDATSQVVENPTISDPEFQARSQAHPQADSQDSLGPKSSSVRDSRGLHESGVKSRTDRRSTDPFDFDDIPSQEPAQEPSPEPSSLHEADLEREARRRHKKKKRLSSRVSEGVELFE